jgi:hypothetical protein
VTTALPVAAEAVSAWHARDEDMARPMGEWMPAAPAFPVLMPAGVHPGY